MFHRSRSSVTFQTLKDKEDKVKNNRPNKKENTNLSLSQSLINYSDFHLKQTEIKDRLQKSYKVKQEIHFEMTETDKIMKRMKEIMEGGADGVGEATNDGFEIPGLQKGAIQLN